MFHQLGRTIELVSYTETAIENFTDEERMIHFGDLRPTRPKKGIMNFASRNSATCSCGSSSISKDRTDLEMYLRHVLSR